MDSPKRRQGQNFAPPSLLLAARQLPQTWRLIVLTAFGLIITVMLVCATPIFSQIALTAGLWKTIRSNPDNGNILVDSHIASMQVADYQNLDQAVKKSVQQHIGSYLTPDQPTSTQIIGLNMPSSQGLRSELNLIGVPTDREQEIALVSGRLPDPAQAITVDTTTDIVNPTTPIEVALPDDVATSLGLTLGATFTAQAQDVNSEITPHLIVFSLVGTVKEPAETTAYWTTNSLADEVILSPSGSVIGYTHMAILPQQTVLALTAALTDVVPTGKYAGDQFGISVIPYWFYTLDTQNLDITKLDTITSQFSALNQHINDEIHFSFAGNLDLSGGLFEKNNSLSFFNNQSISLQIPILFLIVEFIGIAIYFVALMADVLFDRQTEAIATLRSRGFSRQQITRALAWQYLGVAVISFVVGLVLAIPAAWAIGTALLSTEDKRALTILADPLKYLVMILPYAAIVVVCALAASLIAIGRALRLDMLALRREAARSTRRPLWQRLRLDIVLAVLGIAIFGVASYLNEAIAGASPEVDRLLSPVFLIAPIVFVYAVVLLLLRAFSVILRWMAQLAQRSRNAPAMLALAQIARAPANTLRMALLLTLAVAATMFIFAFASSHQARQVDVANYLVGADYTAGTNLTPNNIAKISGVQSVTEGYIGSLQHFSGFPPTSSSYTVIAADLSTYEKTILWPQQDGALPTTTLDRMHATASTEANGVLALADQQMWNDLQLGEGQTLTLKKTFGGRDFIFTIVGKVPAIPNIPIGGSGLLVDYSQFRNYTLDNTFNANQLWVRTNDDPTTRAAVTKALNATSNSLLDRRALQASIEQDPLNTVLSSILAIGVILPLALMIVGNVTASRLVIQRRLRSFAVLRALGANSRHITSIMLWEQGLAHAIALIMGVIAGVLLTFNAVPHLLFTGIAPNAVLGSLDVFQIQDTPPVRVIFPPTTFFVLGVLIISGVLVLWFGVTRILRTSLSQALRLNED